MRAATTVEVVVPEMTAPSPGSPMRAPTISPTVAVVTATVPAAIPSAVCSATVTAMAMSRMLFCAAGTMSSLSPGVSQRRVTQTSLGRSALNTTWKK